MGENSSKESAPHDSELGGPMTCANCGSLIDTTRWYPIVTKTEGGSIIFHAFCDDQCAAAWKSLYQAE